MNFAKQMRLSPRNVDPEQRDIQAENGTHRFIPISFLGTVLDSSKLVDSMVNLWIPPTWIRGAVLGSVLTRFLSIVYILNLGSLLNDIYFPYNLIFLKNHLIYIIIVKTVKHIKFIN